MDSILAGIADGKALRTICIELGIDDSAAHDMLEDTPAFRPRFARAKERRAEIQSEQVLQMAMAAATGTAVNGKKIDPNGARVFMDAVKWHAGRMAPRTMGDKQTVDLNVRQVDLSGLSDEELEELDRIRARLADHRPADDQG